MGTIRTAHTKPQRRPKVATEHRRLLKKARVGLHGELDAVVRDVQKRVSEIATKYKRSKPWVRAQLYGGSKSARFLRGVRKVRLYDAYVHWKSKEMNEDPPDGEPYKLDAIKEKIRKERPNYKNRSAEDKQLWLDEYARWKEETAREKRLNRKGVQQDASGTLKNLSNDLDTLKQRTGVRSLVFAARPEVLFTMDPWVHCDKSTEEFCVVALGKTPDQIARLFEMWTIHGPSGLIRDAPKNADELKSASRRLIQSKLDDVIALRYKGSDLPHVEMNYDSYDDAILARHRVRLLNWTFNGGKFKNPGKLPMAEVRQLYAGLINRTVRWELVPEPEEGEDDVIPVGKPKPRKVRSDKGGKHKKHIATTDPTPPAAKRQRTAKKAAAAEASANGSDSPSDSDPDSD